MSRAVDTPETARSFTATADAGLLERNLAAFGTGYPEFAREVRAASDVELELATAGDGQVTGTWMGRRLASRHRPGEEADCLLEEIDLRETATVAVLGFGLGLHVEKLARRMKRTGIVLVLEPDTALLKAVFSRIDLSDWVGMANVLVVTNPEDVTSLQARLAKVDSLLMLGMRLLEHPPSSPRIGEYGAVFSRALSGIAGAARMTLMTALGRSVDTIENLLSNIDHYALGSGLDDLRGAAAGRLGVVVSAGPSLQRNLHVLARPGVRDRCVIVATQTTLRPLLEAGVAPHFVTALDYHEISTRFYEGIKAEDVAHTELVVDPKVNPAVPDAWPGRLRVTNSSELDQVLGSLGRDGEVLEGCTTVAHLAYALARHLGCDPVALIGQDLGFTDGLYYAPGNAIHEVWRPEFGMFNTVETMEWERIVRHRGQLSEKVDAHGRTIYTDEQMLAYLQQFEVRFQADHERGLRTIDATEGGVRKEHAEARRLEDVLEDHAGGGGVVLPAAGCLDDTDRVRVADRLETVRREAVEIASASKAAHGIISSMIESQENAGRMSGLFAELEKEQTIVADRNETYRLVDMLNQLGVFRRMRADRRIELTEKGTAIERQRAQLDRDLVNVEWGSEAAGELALQLEQAIRLVRDGTPVEPRGRSADLSREVGLEGPGADAVRVAAVVAVDPAVGGTGLGRDLSHGGHPLGILQRTLERLGASKELAGIVVLVPDDLDVEAGIVRDRIGLPVEWHRCGPSVFGQEHDAIRAARAFADTAWRGGIHGLCAFDEILAPGHAHAALEQGNFDGGLVVGADWVLLPVHGDAGVDCVVRRFREQPGLGFTFNQAPPGLGGMVLARTLLAEFARNRIRHSTLGHLLGYRPERPEHDLVASDHNVPVSPGVRSAAHRFIADSPRQMAILEPWLDKTEIDAGDLVNGADSQLHAEMIHTTPNQVMVEICTDRPGASTSQEHRGPMHREVFTRLVTGLAAGGDCALTFHGLGDPLRHPEFDEFVRIAHDAGVAAVHVRTELDTEPGTVDRLLACEPHVVSVDLDGDSAATRAAVHGIDAWSVIMANLDRLIEGRRVLAGHGVGAIALPWIVPRLVRCHETLPDQATFFERWRRTLGTAVIEDPLVPQAEEAGGQEHAARTWPPKSYIAEKSMRMMTVLADGSVPLFGGGAGVGEVVGNLENDDIADAWRTLVEARRRQRREHGIKLADRSMTRW
ncbi:MAG: DUF115 domain-containing protein [Phycisphaerales bacterium]|nr:DUF115 domain-containing protein [Phycisphaerales bacterium]